MPTPDFAVGAIETALRNRVAGLGLVPLPSDIFRTDAFVALFGQILGRMGGVGFRQTVNSNVITNTVAETAFSPASSVFTIPASALNSAGRVIRFRANGVIATAATPTLILRARLGGLGGVVVAQTVALLAANNSTAAGFFFEGGFVVRTTGAAANLRPQNARGALVNAASGAAAPVSSLSSDGAADVVANLTTALDLVITAQWSAAAAGNQATLTGFEVDIAA